MAPLLAVFANQESSVPSRRRFPLGLPSSVTCAVFGRSRVCLGRPGLDVGTAWGSNPKAWRLERADPVAPSSCSWRCRASEMTWRAASWWWKAMEPRRCTPFWSNGATFTNSCAVKSCKQRRSSSRSTRDKLLLGSPSSSFASMKLESKAVFSNQLLRGSWGDLTVLFAEAGRRLGCPLAGRATAWPWEVWLGPRAA